MSFDGQGVKERKNVKSSQGPRNGGTVLGEHYFMYTAPPAPLGGHSGTPPAGRGMHLNIREGSGSSGTID